MLPAAIIIIIVIVVSPSPECSLPRLMWEILKSSLHFFFFSSLLLLLCQLTIISWWTLTTIRSAIALTTHYESNGIRRQSSSTSHRLGDGWELAVRRRLGERRRPADVLHQARSDLALRFPGHWLHRGRCLSLLGVGKVELLRLGVFLLHHTHHHR